MAASLPTRLSFRIGRWSRFVLWGWGVRQGHREVVLEADRVVVRFGFLDATVPLADIERWDITGPYHWVRAIGIRHSPFRRDISCCTDAAGAVRLWLRTPRRILFVRQAQELFLGVEDLDGFAAWLRDRDIPGEDLRGR